MSFVTYLEISTVVFFICVAGVVYYLKRRGVLRAAANAATAAVKEDVSAAADKLTK
jgi:hypothetical protein